MFEGLMKDRVKVTVMVGEDVVEESVIAYPFDARNIPAEVEVDPTMTRTLARAVNAARHGERMKSSELARRSAKSEAQIFRLMAAENEIRSYLIPRFARALGKRVTIVCEPLED